MKKLLTSGHMVLTLLLLGTWAASHAQSLGTPSATAWIGRPLEMTVPTRFASGDSRDECVHADVFFGDTRLPPERVRATVLGSDPQHKRVRVETQALIDEPVVTVSVRVGCRNAITRSYTLLPDLPSEQVLASLAAQHLGAPQAPLSTAMAAASAMAPLQLAPATGTSSVVSPRVRPVPTVGAAPQEGFVMKARKARGAEPGQAQVAAAPPGPRLRLEPLELDGQPFLRVSARLAEPAGDAARRATAAMLWQAINADPQEVLRTTVMLQNLERELAQLRQSAGQTRAEMAALRQRLDEARPWYGSGAALQLVGLLLLVAGAAAAVLWYRTRRSDSGHWYAQPVDAAPAAAVPSEAAQPAPGEADDAPGLAQGPEQAPEHGLEHGKEHGQEHGKVPQQAQAQAQALAAARAAARAAAVQAPDFQDTAPQSVARAPAPAQALRVETLAATFEEVEFLTSLGLTADAAGVLRSYLQDSASPAPIAFHEWMRLCEQEQDAGAAAAARRRYAKAFGVEAPPLEQVIAPVGLDGLPALSARITASWNTPGVLQVIEQALFGAPTEAAPLTLQAGRDLLCLHEIATSLAAEASARDEAGEGHALAPWAHAENLAGAQEAVQAATEVGDPGALGVDIDVGMAVPDPLPTFVPPDLAPLIAQMQAAAREAQDRAGTSRRLAEHEDAFNAATASERMRLTRP